MYTFPSINLTFALGIGVFQSHRTNILMAVHKLWLLAGGGWREKNICPACSTQPDLQLQLITTGNYFNMQHVQPLPATSRVTGPIAHGCWRAPHVSPALPGGCLCNSAIRVEIYVWTPCSGTASRFVEERVKKGRGSGPGLVTAWSHILDLPPPGPPVYQTGQSLSKR